MREIEIWNNDVEGVTEADGTQEIGGRGRVYRERVGGTARARARARVPAKARARAKENAEEIERER